MPSLHKSKFHGADVPSQALPTTKRRRCSNETAARVDDGAPTMHQEESNPTNTSMTMDQLSEDILIHVISYFLNQEMTKFQNFSKIWGMPPSFIKASVIGLLDEFPLKSIYLRKHFLVLNFVKRWPGSAKTE